MWIRTIRIVIEIRADFDDVNYFEEVFNYSKLTICYVIVTCFIKGKALAVYEIQLPDLQLEMLQTIIHT